MEIDLKAHFFYSFKRLHKFDLIRFFHNTNIHRDLYYFNTEHKQPHINLNSYNSVTVKSNSFFIQISTNDCILRCLSGPENLTQMGDISLLKSQENFEQLSQHFLTELREFYQTINVDLEFEVTKLKNEFLNYHFKQFEDMYPKPKLKLLLPANYQFIQNSHSFSIKFSDYQYITVNHNDSFNDTDYNSPVVSIPPGLNDSRGNTLTYKPIDKIISDQHSQPNTSWKELIDILFEHLKKKLIEELNYRLENKIIN